MTHHHTLRPTEPACATDTDDTLDAAAARILDDVEHDAAVLGNVCAEAARVERIILTYAPAITEAELGRFARVLREVDADHPDTRPFGVVRLAAVYWLARERGHAPPAP